MQPLINHTTILMFQDYFAKAIDERYPGLRDGPRCSDFNDEKVMAERERYDEISRVMDASLRESDRVEISNDVFHFI